VYWFVLSMSIPRKVNSIQYEDQNHLFFRLRFAHSKMLDTSLLIASLDTPLYIQFHATLRQKKSSGKIEGNIASLSA